MAANTHSVAKSAAGSQASSSFADIVNFSEKRDNLVLENRSTTVNIWWTFKTDGSAATTPTSAGDDCYYLPAGAFRSYPIMGVTQVKLIGDAATTSYVASVF